MPKPRSLRDLIAKNIAKIDEDEDLNKIQVEVGPEWDENKDNYESEEIKMNIKLCLKKYKEKK